MKYSHVMSFFDKQRQPIYLTQDQAKRIKSLEPMPQMLWIGDNCINTGGMEAIMKLPKESNALQKCSTCSEYKPMYEPCPRCEADPKLRNERTQAFDKLKENLTQKFGWEHEAEEQVGELNCKACDTPILTGEFCKDCKKAYS